MLREIKTEFLESIFYLVLKVENKKKTNKTTARILASFLILREKTERPLKQKLAMLLWHLDFLELVLDTRDDLEACETVRVLQK